MGKTDIEWATVSDAIGYQVSSQGQVIGPSGRILKPIRSKSGHLYIFIHRKKRWVHHLVLEAFVGRRTPGKEARHLDGRPEHNDAENLMWGTRLENMDDRRRHGTMPIPHQSVFTKLSPADIPEIRRLHERGLSSREIGVKYKTSHSTIQKIIRGERWKGY